MGKIAGGKNAKHSRFKLKCASYRNSRKRDKNKKRKLGKHLKSHGTDRQALHAFNNIFV